MCMREKEWKNDPESKRKGEREGMSDIFRGWQTNLRRKQILNVCDMNLKFIVYMYLFYYSGKNLGWDIILRNENWVLCNKWEYLWKVSTIQLVYSQFILCRNNYEFCVRKALKCSFFFMVRHLSPPRLVVWPLKKPFCCGSPKRL